MVATRALEASENRGQDLLGGETPARAEPGAEADLQPSDVLPGVVLGELVRDPLEGVRVLHDGQREAKPLQVTLEAHRVRHDHPGCETRRVGGGQLDAALARELDQRGWAERSIEVYVQLGLGQPEEALARAQQRKSGPSGEASPFSTSMSGAGYSPEKHAVQ